MGTKLDENEDPKYDESASKSSDKGTLWANGNRLANHVFMFPGNALPIAVELGWENDSKTIVEMMELLRHG